jgi:type IV pilus assembly protein PilY1
MIKLINRIVPVIAVAGLISTAFGGAVIRTGDIVMGINNEGHQNFYTSSTPYHPGVGGYVGIGYVPVGDATSPGCQCEGWGVSANNSYSGYANVSTDGGARNLSVESFTSGADWATSKVHLTNLPMLQVTQEYRPAAEAPGALFEDLVTITNSGSTELTDVKYVRVMDWDVPPTEFSEYVSIVGTGTTDELELSHDDGFATANPLVNTTGLNPITLNSDFTDVGPADHGAYFRFNFGTLAAGEEKQFKIYYGAAPTEDAALAALGEVGTELYSLGQQRGAPVTGTPATFMFAFSGVGGEVIIPDPTPSSVPEPSSMCMIVIGLMSLAGAHISRRRK